MYNFAGKFTLYFYGLHVIYNQIFIFFSDLDICGNDLMCKEYHSIANNLTEHTYLEVRNVTEYSNERPNTTIIYYKGKSNPYVECNNLTDSLKARYAASNRTNDSSYSPWKYVINRDYNRWVYEYSYFYLSDFFQLGNCGNGKDLNALDCPKFYETA